jgi:hypothetical protein
MLLICTANTQNSNKLRPRCWFGYLATLAVRRIEEPSELRQGERKAVLALQLSFCFKVRALSDRLVSSTPE